MSMGQRTNYAYGIYRFSGRRYDITDPDDVLLRTGLRRILSP